MPKNKKPRKKYHPKPIRYNGVSKHDLDFIRALMRNTELKTLIKLGYGECTYEDISEMRSLLNAALFGMVSRQNVYDKAEVEANYNALVEAGNDLANVAIRGNPTEHYVCRGPELKRLEAAVGIANDFIKDCLEVCPATMLTEFTATILLRDAAPTNADNMIELSDVIMRQAVAAANRMTSTRDPYTRDAVREREVRRLRALIKSEAAKQSTKTASTPLETAEPTARAVLA